MKIKINWKGKRRFDGTGRVSEISLPIDTSVESGGENTGFSPMELLLMGLAGCTGLDVISILEKKRQEVTNFEIRVQGERAEDHPRIFTHIVVEYIVTGHHIDPAAVERAVELSVTKYCSAEAMLSKAAQIENKITVLEAEVQ